MKCLKCALYDLVLFYFILSYQAPYLCGKGTSRMAMRAINQLTDAVVQMTSSNPSNGQNGIHVQVGTTPVPRVKSGTLRTPQTCARTKSVYR